MSGLSITQENLTNQQGVVINEVRGSVLNQPYGGFPWLDMPQYANTNWYNAHNFYGDLADIEAEQAGYIGGTPTGTYTATITNVTASGYSWDGVPRQVDFSLQ